MSQLFCQEGKDCNLGYNISLRRGLVKYNGSQEMASTENRDCASPQCRVPDCHIFRKHLSARNNCDTILTPGNTLEVLATLRQPMMFLIRGDPCKTLELRCISTYLSTRYLRITSVGYGVRPWLSGGVVATATRAYAAWLT
jgi:hypothetical protein